MGYIEEKAKMEVAYASAEKEYKNGNIKGGDAKMEQGRASADKAATECYKKGGAELEKGNEKAAKGYYDQGNQVKSDSKKKEEELAEIKKQAQEKSQSPKEGEGRNR